MRDTSRRSSSTRSFAATTSLWATACTFVTVALRRVLAGADFLKNHARLLAAPHDVGVAYAAHRVGAARQDQRLDLPHVREELAQRARRAVGEKIGGDGPMRELVRCGGVVDLERGAELL